MIPFGYGTGKAGHRRQARAARRPTPRGDSRGTCRRGRHPAAQAQARPVRARGRDKLAVTLEKRIHTIGRSRSFLDWEKGRELAKEIDHLRTTIAGPLAERNALLAAERMWDLVGIADAVLARIHGSAQAAVEAFEAAIEDLARLWSTTAARQPAALARRVFAALQGDRGYLELQLVQAMATPLGPDGRAELRSLVDHALAELPEPGDELRDWRTGAERRRWTAVLALLADSEGDVDAYIDAAERGGVAMVQATDIALRLIKAGRPEEALGWLDQAQEANRAIYIISAWTRSY